LQGFRIQEEEAESYKQEEAKKMGLEELTIQRKQKLNKAKLLQQEKSKEESQMKEK
jgi:hypothetical protein